jgi:RNA polymerase sigma factor (TIGR02999 family)
MYRSAQITQLLEQWSAGNQAALDALVPLLYDDLRRMASNYMRGERINHLLQTTALVHEAYLRLVGRENVNCHTRAGFFAVAAQVMRHILVDDARGRNRAKRGEGVPPLRLEEAALISEDRAEEIIAIDSALSNLSAVDPRKSKVFEMRYFGGMAIDEVAEALDVSPVTVAREWRMAKVWLRREMTPRAPDAI